MHISIKIFNLFNNTCILIELAEATGWRGLVNKHQIKLKFMKG